MVKITKNHVTEKEEEKKAHKTFDKLSLKLKTVVARETNPNQQQQNPKQGRNMLDQLPELI